MRIASISLVKNEADILEGFVRHNLHFVDRMYLIDDRSTDNTPEILRRLTAESDRVQVLEDGWTGAFHQARRTTGALHLIRQADDWDFVLALDADELICASERAVFEADLAAIPPGMAGAFAELRYLAGPDDNLDLVDPLARLHWTLPCDTSAIFKSIAPRAMLDDASLAFSEGNHHLISHGAGVPTFILPHVPLAHFAIRSVDQIAIKCLKHYVGWRSRGDYDPILAGDSMAGVETLRAEPRFALSADAAIVPTYCRNYEMETARPRPFTERHGALKWPELAVSPPYDQLVGMLDQLIAAAATADALIKASGGTLTTDAVGKLVEENKALMLDLRIAGQNAHQREMEVQRLTSSPSKLAKAYWKAVGRRLTRSLSKRRAARAA
ncbi:hypothetical protein GCM10007301_13940 [Azorhizobium oxalatiphilum]|uniref:Glycosyl transferase family 2 n=1 Tax=Azorhizobium oxalatiphilum TaxID=980631 RepID=A0A917F7F8_9HYPH|nr:glycosyltransferase family 2 protein [Azorhizobium oxalatiphilum]GGF55510.1 hypothetical protein GCM10007301_13940 [Azorhizobium oxalatiphilum]